METVLRAFAELAALTPEGHQHLEGLLTKPLELRPRRKLLDEAKPCDSFFIVMSGWLQDYRQLKNGRRQILNFRLPGEVIGIECLLYRRALYSCMALTACTVAPVSRAGFERTLESFPQLANAFLMSSVRDGAILHEWAVNLGRRPAFQRIAHLFLELERRLLIMRAHSGATLPFPLKQQDIADCTGLTAPYVNRILQQMRNQGLLELHDESLKICNFDALARVAGFQPDYLEVSPQTRCVRTPELPEDTVHDPVPILALKSAAGAQTAGLTGK